MKKIAKLIAAVIVILILAAVWYEGKRLYDKFGPNNETIPLTELYSTSGDNAAVFYNYVLQKEKGIWSDGEIYLSCDWVNDTLNERFYWDKAESKVLYALPDSLVTIDEKTTGDDGKKLLIKKNGKAYISSSLVKKYTDIHTELFGDDEVKRIFIGNDWKDQSVVQTTGKTELRAIPSVKGRITEAVGRGEKLKAIPLNPDMDQTAASEGKWQRVVSESGITGYIEEKRIQDAGTEAYTHDFRAPVYKNISMNKPVILVWHQVTNKESNKTLSSELKDTEGINAVSPTWYSLKDNEGNYDSFASADYVKTAHDKGLQVWPLIDNFSDNVTLGTLLSKTSTRQKLIANLIAEADKYGFDGINIDFEEFKQEAAGSYIEFIRELSVSCRKKGLVLSVDVPNYASYNLHYNRKELGTVTDYVINMGYDEHTVGDGHGKGSTASYDFVKEGIEGSLTEVPREKLINAIPFYTRVWTESDKGTLTADAYGISAAKKWVTENGVRLTWDGTLGQYYGELHSSKNANTKYIWMEEEKSIAKKMELIRQKNLAGVACWKLGLETPEVWEEVNAIGK